MNCEIDNCTSPATHAFVWPWGTPSRCCGRHLVVVQQKAQAARGRFGTVSFQVLDPNAPVKTIQRDERTKLIAERLSAEAERDEVRKSNAELLRVNGELMQQVQLHRTRCQALETQAVELRKEVEVAIQERDRALLESAKAHEEAEALGVRMRAAPIAPQGAPVSRSFSGAQPFGGAETKS